MSNPIKEKNRSKVIWTLHRVHTATKARLSELTGISVVTMQGIIKQLEEEKFVIEDEMVQPELGRPAVSYRFLASARYLLLIQMYEKEGQDTIRFSVTDLYGVLVYEKKDRIEGDVSNLLVEWIQMFVNQFPNISMIAIGIPGEEIDGTIVVMDYKELLNRPLAQELSELFERPVFIENDINGAIAGYISNNSEHKNDCICGIYMPGKYPPGAAIWQQGQIMKGARGMAGEVQYLPFGIDWNSFDHNQERVDHFLCQLMQTMCCLYNPKEIVLYDELRDTAFIQKAKNILQEMLPEVMLPEIIPRESLEQDYQAGLVSFALTRVFL